MIRALTYLAPEEHAYTPRGSQVRRCTAFYPDGIIRRVYAGIPDTFFTIPAHGRVRGKHLRGYLTVSNGGYLIFNVYSGSV